MRRIVTTGASIGTRIIACWVWRGPAGSGLPIKISIQQRGSPAREIHHFPPFMTYSWLLRTRRYWIVVAVETLLADDRLVRIDVVVYERREPPLEILHLAGVLEVHGAHDSLRPTLPEPTCHTLSATTSPNASPSSRSTIPLSTRSLPACGTRSTKPSRAAWPIRGSMRSSSSAPARPSSRAPTSTSSRR